MESVNKLKSVVRKRPLDATEEASSSKKAKMAGRGVTVDEASETKMPYRSMSLDLNNFPNDPLALSPYDKPVVQIEERKETVERRIDTWMQEETKKNPDNSDQIQSVSQMLKEKINSASGVIEGNLNFSNYTHLTSLPDNLTVYGSLNLDNCTNLTSLPENLTVSDDLNLNNCTSLTSLPDNLTVGGNLHLKNCTSLMSLPDNFTVNGDLDFDGCTNLTYLPENLTVNGDLSLSDCISLTFLPENLFVRGDLNLKNCTSLTYLPENFMIGENLNLRNCTNLTSLPDTFTVNGDLYLSNCTSLMSLPENLLVRGDLDLDGCTSLTFLPENLTVGGNLDLRNCTRLTSLPENLHVNGSLYLSGCTSLTSLPDNLTVDGNLHLKNCTSLMFLPDNFTVNGDLDFDGCTNLTYLPENLTVNGDLNLSDCISLTFLPENLFVRGDLNLKNCTSLTSLPENFMIGENLNLRNCINLMSLPDTFTVNGDLNLSNCTSLMFLPKNLHISGDLNLSGCIRITSLSSDIIFMGRTMDGNLHRVYLEESGLSLEIIQRLQQIEDDGSAPGMQFIFSMPGAHSQITFSSIVVGFDYWRKLTDVKNLTCPNLEKLTSDEAANLCRFLTRLIDTAEYKNINTRPKLACRVLYFLAEIEKNEEFKEIACLLIYDSLASCDDRIILALDNIDLLMRISAAYKEVIDSDHASGTALKALAKQIIMLEKVDKAANEHIESSSFVDPIEVQLAFRLGLREKLNLPISTQHMTFRSLAYITDEKIDAAGDKILQEYDESELEIFLRVWSPWQQYERSQDVTLYEALPEVYDIGLNIDVNTGCPITLETLAYPVLLKDIKYEYAELKKHYIDNGKNPLTREPMLWEDVRKIVSAKM